MTASQSWGLRIFATASAAFAANSRLRRGEFGELDEKLGIELGEFPAKRARAHLELRGGFPHGNDVVRVNLVHGARDGGRHCFAPPATESERGLVDDDEAGVDVGGELRESLLGVALEEDELDVLGAEGGFHLAKAAEHESELTSTGAEECRHEAEGDDDGAPVEAAVSHAWMSAQLSAARWSRLHQ